MFDFAGATVPIRSDIATVFEREWAHLATPGAALSSQERLAVASEARNATRDGDAPLVRLQPTVSALAATLMADPGAVEEPLVRSTADATGEPTAVETIGIVSRLSAVDGFHRAMGLALEPLPEEVEGEPTGEITPDLKRRRTHVPMPSGPIPVSLDLVPAEGLAMESLAGALYMTYEDMAHHDFERQPGLNRAQMELISSRTSHRNGCFY